MRPAPAPKPGYGVSVVPLQYVSAQTLLKLMDSFATKAGAVRADATRNLLLIQGTGAERRTAVDTALSFDVDWMRGQSVGIFPISSGSPAPIIAELEKIVDSGENGLSQNVIKFQPVVRLNAIMVVTRKPEMLRTAATWIKRLDRADTARTTVHVYRVKYGEARQIARVLTDMFIGGSSSNLLDSRRQPDRAGIRHVHRRRAPIACRSTRNSSSTMRRLWPPRRDGEQQRRSDLARRTRRASDGEPRQTETATLDSGRGSRQRPAGAAGRADHARCRQQHAADLRGSGELPDHRSHPAADRSAAAAGRDRRDDRRGDAQQRA